MTNGPVRAVVIGCGSMGRYHIDQMLQQADTTRIEVLCEPSEEAHAAAAARFEEHGLRPPPNEPDLRKLLCQHAGRLDADIDGDPIKNIYNWKRNATSISVLNMPFENNGSDAGTNDYSGNNNDGSEQGSITWNATGGYDVVIIVYEDYTVTQYPTMGPYGRIFGSIIGSLIGVIALLFVFGLLYTYWKKS